jgi:hypothetical protein
VKKRHVKSKCYDGQESITVHRSVVPLPIDTSLTLEIPLVDVEESGHNVKSPLKGWV